MKKLFLAVVALGLTASAAFADRGRGSFGGGFSYDRGARYEHRSGTSFGLSLGFSSGGYRDRSYGSIYLGSSSYSPRYRDSYCSTPDYYSYRPYRGSTYCPPTYYSPPVVYREPVYVAPAPVYVAPAPVTYYDRPVYTSDVYVAPTYTTTSSYYPPAPVYYRSAPTCTTYSYDRGNYGCPSYYRPAPSCGPVYGGSSIQFRATYNYRR